MLLKFPHARLFVQNLLSAPGVSGPEALVSTACEYGLISPECISDLSACGACADCACTSMAKAIIFKHFEKKNKISGRPIVNPQEVWLAVEKAIQSYKRLAPVES